jgi:heme exporter protein C
MLLRNKIHFIILFVSFILSLYAIFFYAPIEVNQGIVQKIFYFHAPSAWVSFLSFFIVFLSSILYIIKRDKKWDRIAYSSAEIGIIFCTLVLITGSLWGKAIWGAWWTWDSRLTSTLILWLIYMVYMMIRYYGDWSEKIARFCAILGIIGFLDIPIIHMSVLWWRTLHPNPVVLRREGIGSGLPYSMLIVLIGSFISFTILYLYILLERIKIEQLKDNIEIMKGEIEENW